MRSSGSLWQYYRDEPSLNNAGEIIDFHDNNNNNNNNNNNSLPKNLKCWVGIRWEIVCLMGRKNSSALGGSLSRDGVSIKTLVGGSHKKQPQIE